VKPNTPTREIVIQARAWICSDGETWHAGSPDDRLIYNWAHVPIMVDRRFPAFEKSGRRTTQRDRPGYTCGSRSRRRKSIQRSYAYSNIDTYGHSHADSNSNTYY
jgi:hypothetical protein